MISATALEQERHRMSLHDRVEARRALDVADGITYPPLPDTAAATLARLLTGDRTC
ncbi:hypothetical protein GFY24_00965 [Nocardia sp. SYP-A9097]|uniref:hypothetical protein n=1 Tax=Nocardia sp. SYP-A9097 TaxID=2663237 RepID=UPI00129A9B82|nr:hypothetical protein [Nocardia sp. SYP-A9097]MRH86048.1 hypothetical protein [Nocardia sp. SYP-A9097]